MEPLENVSGCPVAGLALARSVTAEIRRRGKHHLSEPLLTRLAEVRDRGVADPCLAAFLHGVLDKHDGRFHNRTYLALPLLEELTTTAEEMATLLIADVVRHERETPDDTLDPRTRRARLRHAERFVGAAESAPELDPPATDWFSLTVHPVSVLHDEYFFIRVLQAHEMLFTVLTCDVRAATRELRSGSFAAGVAHLDHANALLDRAVMLFRIVATMRPATFTSFRAHTQGASAIQSEQYKRFELACGAPTGARLRSDAFVSVPGVVAEAGVDDLTGLYLDALRDGGFGPAEWAALDARIHTMERRHQRWKAAHVGLATRMLGDAAGSGYTSGVPYLRACLDNRLFWQLGTGREAAA